MLLSLFLVFIVKECCGITFSKAFKWTLRNGRLIRKFNGTDQFAEPRIVFGDAKYSDSLREYTDMFWGTVSFTKDCFGDRKGI